MFDIGWSELLIVVVVAVVVIGPKELPRALRTVGQWTARARRMAGDFQRQFNEAIREAELEDVKNEVADIGRIDPIGDIRKEITKTGSEIRSGLENATKIEPAKSGKPSVEADPEMAEPAPAADGEAAASPSVETSPPPSTPAVEPPPAVAAGDAKP